jgi:hypothetical protein
MVVEETEGEGAGKRGTCCLIKGLPRITDAGSGKGWATALRGTRLNLPDTLLPPVAQVVVDGGALKTLNNEALRFDADLVTPAKRVAVKHKGLTRVLVGVVDRKVEIRLVAVEETLRGDVDADLVGCRGEYGSVVRGELALFAANWRSTDVAGTDGALPIA